MRIALLVCLIACGDAEEITSSEDELAKGAAPNNGFEGTSNKVAAFIDCNDAPLLYFPDGKGGSVATLEKNRPVLVQRAPGVVDGHLWTDPDIWGLRAANEQDARDARWGKGKVTLQTIAGMKEIERRGWVRLSCLRAARSSDPLPSGQIAHPFGDSEVIHTGKTIVRHVKAQCAIPENVRYRNSDGTPVSYHSYGSLHGSPVYLEYNTPSARTPKGLGGGGMTRGYVAGGEEFRIKSTLVDSNVISPQGNDGKWAYGYLASQPSVWGFLYWDCLQ